MSNYSITPRGEAIAQESGLSTMAQNIAKLEYLDIPLFGELTSRHWNSLSNFGYDFETMEKDAISFAASHTRSDDEKVTLARGLEINPDHDRWRYISGVSDDTLFPVSQLHDFTAASELDRYVLSGVVGSLFERYKSRYPILARSRSEEFGFSNHMEACVFAGAYLMTKVVESDHYLFNNFPSFSITDNDLKYDTTIGATFHGDFTIKHTKTTQNGAVAPTGTVVDFSPKETVLIGGYHSLEPDITAALITDEYTKHGVESALSLISDFESTSVEHANDSGEVDYRTGPFGDYGAGDTFYPLIQLAYKVKHPEKIDGSRRNHALYSAPAAPQSPSLLEIIASDVGIRFQRRMENMENSTAHIDIPREKYTNLFSALLTQAQLGLGRTSPQQHLEILKKAKKILTQTK